MTPAIFWPWALGAVIVLAIAIIGALVHLLRKAAKVTKIGVPPEDEEEEAPPDATQPYGTMRIGSAFRNARKELYRLGAGDRYAAPLALVVGTEGSREAGFLRRTAGAGLEFFGDPVTEGLAFGEGREFLFFDRGVVLDVAGEPVLGSGGKHADDGAWRGIVRGLIELRPKRPADSVVVTVSCSELKQAAGDDALQLAIAEAAAAVRKRLWNLEDKSGFRLPLYVLVTNCEVLEGFAETVTALAPADRGQLLGWSSPYGAQVPYQSVWIDKAFSSLREALSGLQMALFAKGERDPKVMLFPWSFAPIAKSLRTFLDQLLSPGARQEGSMTRGIYFCGEVPAEFVANPFVRTGEEAKPRTAFAADLFAQKVFKEAGLATPAAGLRVTRSRKAKAVHWAAAVLALLTIAGLTSGAYVLENRHDKVVPLLKESKADVDDARDGNIAGAPLSEAATRLLERTGAVDFDGFAPLWLPATWFSSFNGDLDKAIAKSFESVVLRAIRQSLDNHARSLIREATGHIVSSDPAGEVYNPAVNDTVVEPVDRTAEFVRFKTFVTEIRKVEQNGALFNRVATFGEGDVDALKTLLEATLNQPLPPVFLRQHGEYSRAVKAFTLHTRFDPKSYAVLAGDAAKQQAQALFTRLFLRNPSAMRVKQLTLALDPAALQHVGRGEVSAESFRQLDAAINDLQSDLSTPALDWEFHSSFDLGPEFADVLSKIEHSQMFEPETARTITAIGTEGLRRLQAELAARTGLGFTVLKLRSGGGPSNELSNMTEVLHTAVQSYLGEKFAAGQDLSSTAPPFYEPGKRLVWDNGDLDQAASVYAAYNEFREGGLKKFPASFQPAIDDAAQQNAVMRISTLLAHARRFEPIAPAVTPGVQEENVRIAAMSFRDSSKALHAQITALRSLKSSGGTAAEIVDAASVEAARLLRSVDALLNESTPYAPKAATFDWWDGKTPAAPAAWGAHDAGELAEYLETTRARVTAMSESFAEPALSWFAEFGAPADPYDAAIVKRWRSIGNDLRDFTAKKAGNAPALLEDYIAVRASRLTPADCTAAQLTASERPAHGYFADRLKAIASGIGSRCRTIAESRAAERYDELARLFNQRLAGRYPFSEQPLKAGDVEADPEDVRRFFRRFDDSAPLFAAIGDETSPDWFKPARKFVKDMNDVRKFFAAFLDSKKPLRLPEVNVEPQFRVYKERETGANEIIAWSLAFGNETATSREKKKLTWHPGTPVRLTLTWAADAPRIPSVDAARNVFVDGRKVVYEYTNRWSLISALSLRAPLNDLPGGTDEEPVTLLLNVYTKPAGGGVADRQHPSIVYIRLSLSGTDGQPLEVPNFPDAAEPLKRQMVEATP
jgi:type VI secretion system protein ImpL